MLLYYQTVKELRTISFMQLMDFFTNDLYYTDTDSLYIENKHWDELVKQY